MKTLEQKLAEYNGIGPGFDFLRIGLALCIVATHSVLQLGIYEMRQTVFWFTEYAFVPMFFALSGFLVTGSATRLSLKNFLINRGLRILPALAVDVVVCALIIGPLMTTRPLSSYFLDRHFFTYLLNVTGWIHYALPGVFETHINTRVNGALWTVPYEMFCYVIMSGLIATRWVKRPAFVALVALAILFAGFAVVAVDGRVSASAYEVLQFFFVRDGSRLLVSFLLGILFYQLKGRVPYSPALFAGCVVLCGLAAGFLDGSAINSIGNRFILLPALAYIICFLGLTPIPVPRFVHKGDYSYGIYLYHDPLLQVIISLVPFAAFPRLAGPVILFALGLPCVALLATFSWHFIEKPILMLRKKFSFVAKVRGVAAATESGVAPPLPADRVHREAITGEAEHTVLAKDNLVAP